MKRCAFLLTLCLILVLAVAAPICAEETDATQSAAETTPPETQEPPQTEAPPETQAPAETSPSVHTHTWYTATVPSTCTEQGGTVVMCSVCEEVQSVDLAPLAAHTYDNACDTDCNVCGQTRQTEHKLNSGWDYNAQKHWHVCTICSAKGPESDHYPGPAATEDRDQYCLTCGLLMTKRLNHTHRYETVWKSDDTGHWHACQGCEEKGSFADHGYRNPCDADCDLCGYTRNTAHSFAETYQADESGHWQECAQCGEQTPVEQHIAGEQRTETAAERCNLCGWEMVPESGHVHSFSDRWEQDEKNHWQICECAEKFAKAGHVWEDGECAICGAREPTVFPWGILLAVLSAALLAAAAALAWILLRKR